MNERSAMATAEGHAPDFRGRLFSWQAFFVAGFFRGRLFS
jgi:hypothetical protein